MKRFVLDASAGVELLLNTTRARSLSAQFPLSAQWWVPEHYFVEVAGALRRARPVPMNPSTMCGSDPRVCRPHRRSTQPRANSGGYSRAQREVPGRSHLQDLNRIHFLNDSTCQWSEPTRVHQEAMWVPTEHESRTRRAPAGTTQRQCRRLGQLDCSRLTPAAQRSCCLIRRAQGRQRTLQQGTTLRTRRCSVAR